MPLFSNPLIEVPLIELLLIWEEMVDAYHGLNGYGSDTAEIYAYRLMGYSPAAHTHKVPEHLRESADKAANAMVALCEEFQRHHECEITLDNENLDRWLKRSLWTDDKFNHRTHLKVYILCRSCKGRMGARDGNICEGCARDAGRFE